MKKILLAFLIFLYGCPFVFATRIQGRVRDDKGALLPFSSIFVKGTTIGTTANTEGAYFLDLQPGLYTLVCQHVGYHLVEKNISIDKNEITIDFSLSIQQLTLKPVIITNNAEDPAYEIIRHAIAKRPFYRNQVNAFQCKVYIKGQLKLRDYPKTIFGQKVEFDDGDSSRKKMIYLSETVANYSFRKPDKEKIEVTSTRVSGQAESFGFSSPKFLSFYDNIVAVSEALNPRGFISPVADEALGFYRYKFMGSFVENGKLISRIRVIPKRTYEPLFSGYIDIVEDDWRIHSLELLLSKSSQMELADSLRIEQLYMPVSSDIWMLNSQVLYPTVKLFGFDAAGSFVTVYSAYQIEPPFPKKYFTNTIVIYDSASNKRSGAFWDQVRPVPLLEEEMEDYLKKDSLEKVKRDPRYLDSLDRRRNQFTFPGILVYGQTFSRESRKSSFSYPSILQVLSYNSVEGWVTNFGFGYSRRFSDRNSLSLHPTFRYGYTNHHFNADLTARYSFGKGYLNSISVAGGKKVFQLNNGNPVMPLVNSVSTLFWNRNYLKIYEAWFGSIGYAKGIGNGFTIRAGLQIQDRLPLENTDSTFWGKSKYIGRRSPNYPVELVLENFKAHQAAIFSFSVAFRPGTKYIQFPDRKVNIGSEYPLFSLGYLKGINGFLGSDVDFDEWNFSVNDEIGLKLWGEFRYHISAGGFLNNKNVELPDYRHFNGNQLLFATTYLNSFQLLPYYSNSTLSRFFAAGYIEHHFNGFLTNKIPFIKKLNLHLVTGSNGLYAHANEYYYEFFAGIENILKILRIDFVRGYRNGSLYDTGIRIGFKGSDFRNDD